MFQKLLAVFGWSVYVVKAFRNPRCTRAHFYWLGSVNVRANFDGSSGFVNKVWFPGFPEIVGDVKLAFQKLLQIGAGASCS